MNITQNRTFKIENEFDLHAKVVDFINTHYPHAILITTLGENQDTVQKRIKSKMMGYVAGSPDLLILNHHDRYQGFAIEFKTPVGLGVLSEKQARQIEIFSTIGNFKTMVSNDYDSIVIQLIEYFEKVPIPCPHCEIKPRKPRMISKHITHFHRISKTNK